MVARCRHSLVQAGDGDGHAVPDDQLDPETLVHLPVVGVRGADEEHDGGEESEGGVDDPLVLHLHHRPRRHHHRLDEPGQAQAHQDVEYVATDRVTHLNIFRRGFRYFFVGALNIFRPFIVTSHRHVAVALLDHADAAEGVGHADPGGDEC